MQNASSSKFGRFLTVATITLIFFMLCFPEAGFSAVKFDGSPVARGRRDALTGPVYTIDADMGTQRGKNLFHSFSIFDIGTGEMALFTDTGATGPIRNIIARITGSSPSSIDGGIASSIPGANLYLMNPYGFMFGANAWISVPGSFHVTTADYLKMADRSKFYADLGKESTLSAEPVKAFGFLTSRPGTITIEGSKLFGDPLSTISFIGGDIVIKGDPNNPTPDGGAWIVSQGGQVNLVAVASSGEVVVNQPGEPPSVNVSSIREFGNISISDFSFVDVSGFDTGEIGAGTIIVRGGNLQMTTAGLSAQTYGAVSANPVGIDIALTGDMLMEAGSYIYAQTGGYDGSGTGDGGAVMIKAGNLQMQDGSVISTTTMGAGRGGDIHVDVAGDLNLLPFSEISSNTVQSGTGGDITVKAKDITVQGDQASIDANCWTNISAQTFGSGQGGSITIRAGNINVLDGGFISTNLVPWEYFSTIASGKAGNIDIVANNINVSGMIIQEGTGVDFHSRIESRLMTPDATGSGGNISIKGHKITLGEGGYVGTYLTYGSPGQAGNIYVQADTLILNPQGKIESSSVLGAGTEASAGDITIEANRISMVGVGEGSEERINFTGFRSDTFDGTGGNIDIRSNTLTMSRGAQIMTDSSGSGKGGSVDIKSGLVQLAQGSIISAESTSTGYAGNISLDVGTLRSYASTISTDAAMTDGGDITVNARNLVVLSDSKITTSVNGGPETTGGNITIDPRFVVLDDSKIMANAYEGHGGNVNIRAGVFLSSPESVVSASSQLGIDGTVDITSPIKSISGTLAPVSGSYLQIADVERDKCVARIKGGSQSSLTVSGRDGLPPRPGMVLPALAF
jgi:filamentous hemagglutinin family protein